MFRIPKGKRQPGGNARHDSPARKSTTTDAKSLRTVTPFIYLGKIAMVIVLNALFSIGILSTEPNIKAVCAAMVALPCFIIAFEVMMKGRLNLTSLKHIAFWLALGMMLLAMAMFVPTLLCMFGIGALLAHGTELAHQALHKTGTGFGKIDTAIGLVLCGLTMMSFYEYLVTHIRHHVFNGTEQDKESFAYEYTAMDSSSRVVRLRATFMHFSLVKHYPAAIGRMAYALAGKLPAVLFAQHGKMAPSMVAKIERESRWQAIIILAVIGISILFQTTIVLQLWLIPLVIGWGPVHAAIETTEHWHTDHPTKDAMLNTRSLKAGAFAQWFTNFNNCHVGHHACMLIPMENLPAYEGVLVETKPIRHHEESYPAFYVRFFVFIWTGVDEPSVQAAPQSA